jgi:uncharacterized protein
MFSKTLLFCFFLVASQVAAQDIFESARTGNISQIEQLIAIKPDTVNALNTSGFNPLMIACYRGQTACAKFLLEHGAQVNQKSGEGSALQAASYQNNLELVKLLIAHGAELNNQGPDGNTALMYAVLNQNKKMVKFLLDRGADQGIKNGDGQTALSLAMSLEGGTIRKLLQTK